jgi:hypothetical protein
VAVLRHTISSLDLTRIALLAAGFLSLAVAAGVFWASPFTSRADDVLAAVVGLSGALLIGATMLRVVARQVVLLSAMAAVVAILATEGYLRYATMQAHSTNVGARPDARDALLDMRGRGDRAYVSLLHDDITRADSSGERRSILQVGGAPVLPMGGVALATTVLCNETGAWVTYRSDQFGFRNPVKIWNGAIEIAAVGDSFTQGNCVPDGRHFVDLLRRDDSRLLNLGQRGDGPLGGLATIREFAAPKTPALVVWFYFEGNDMPGDFLRELRTPLLRNYLDPAFGQRLMARSDQVSAAFAAYIDARLAQPGRSLGLKTASRSPWWRDVKGLVSLYRLRSAFGFADYPDNGDNGIVGSYAQVIQSAKETIAGWNGQLALVYLPTRRRFVSPGARRILDRYRAAVLKTAMTHDIPILDMTEFFTAHNDPVALFNEHYNEVGHQLVADKTNSFIQALRR